MCGVRGGMTLQALGGVNLPCGWYRVRGQPPTTGGQVHTHQNDPVLAFAFMQQMSLKAALKQ
jgi:hypothetical protein